MRWKPILIGLLIVVPIYAVLAAIILGIAFWP